MYIVNFLLYCSHSDLTIRQLHLFMEKVCQRGVRLRVRDQFTDEKLETFRHFLIDSVGLFVCSVLYRFEPRRCCVFQRVTTLKCY